MNQKLYIYLSICVKLFKFHFQTAIQFSFQSLRQIRIGAKLQEIASKRMYEGWTTIYYAIGGANVGYLRELMTALFGEVEEDEVFAEGQFEDVATRK